MKESGKQKIERLRIEYIKEIRARYPVSIKQATQLFANALGSCIVDEAIAEQVDFTRSK